ncbi:MAG: DUF2236 domain-containing protein [Acidobacteria bacterium]|nr:DUF2236 domain-containing protein [Acidobacteriota bacterium]
MTSRWTADTLMQARREGDRDGDAIIERILSPRSGDNNQNVRGYNHLLDLATVMVTSPELALVHDSLLRRDLDESGEVGRHFEPMPAPDWVDENKLKLASAVWETDSILAIAVLYASSLPACYLMKKGVPALYETDKLAEQTYIFQRIYETGMMLENVMKAGGLKVVRDNSHPQELLAEVLRTHDPDGQWVSHYHGLRRAAGDTDKGPDPEAVCRDFEAATSAATRYIWGDGYIAARKVRFLHSAMRLMLQRPGLSGAPRAAAGGKAQSFMENAAQRTAAWDTATLGVPINQEDLAFVLLTFGYLIPKGMETWGRALPRAEKEAFLHLWRVVGHVMGIRDDLMTDNLDEAEGLYDQILERNGGGSDEGRILTTAVMDFLRSYIPTNFGIDKILPASLIIDQLGPSRAGQIIEKDTFRAARNPLARACYFPLRTTVKTYYWLRDHILRHLPIVGPVVTHITSSSANTLIESWRGSFRRKPFYIPMDATRWVQQRGATPEFQQGLQRWRQHLFNTMAAGLASFVVSGFSVAAALTFFLLGMGWRHDRNLALSLSVGAFALACYLLTVRVPKISDQRPTFDHEPPTA